MTEDELDSAIQAALNKEDTFPQERPVQEEIGKIGLMWPREEALDHEAAPLLLNYATAGCPVDCGPNWTSEHILAALKRGAHMSAKLKDAIHALHEETAEKVKHGYSRVVKWKDIKDALPPALKLSPVAMIPHKSRLFRCILDLSFQLKHNGKNLPSVNSETTKKAPQQSMAQLGLVLKRIIALLANNHSKEFAFRFAKLDIKDGFWRLAVSDADAWNFCYVLPSLHQMDDIDEIEIVVPNSLQMGWCESPPFFCASSETARDVIDNFAKSDQLLLPHPFENMMLPTEAHEPPGVVPPLSPETLIEVFVDDFIGITNDATLKHLRYLSRAMLHGIHTVFPPTDVSGHNGQDPISEKKLQQEEGRWCTKKEILGWIIDGRNYTIQLPPAICQKICNLIKKILKQDYCPLKRFQELAGKLQHASLGIPGGAGLFSPIQMAMIGSTSAVRLTPFVKAALRDWRTIIHELESVPTSVRLLVDDFPDYIAYTDACGLGAGGVVTSGLSAISNVVWNYEWPLAIQDLFHSGILTINDLELAALILGWLALECIADLGFKHVGMFCDNTSAVAWATKLRTSKSLAAARLLRFLGLRLKARQASSLLPMHIAGEDNALADIPSRAFKTGNFFEAAADLTSYFNHHFPLPQDVSWIEFKVPEKLTSRVIKCLLGVQLPMESLIRLPKLGKNIGNIGQAVVHDLQSIPSSPMSPNCNKSSSSRVSLQGSGQALTVTEIKSKFKRSQRRSQPSPRPSSWLANKVRSIKPPTNTNSR